MTYGDREVYVISGYQVYMSPLRAIICPNGEVLLMNSEELIDVPRHLSTWALPISKSVQDQ